MYTPNREEDSSTKKNKNKNKNREEEEKVVAEALEVMKWGL